MISLKMPDMFNTSQTIDSALLVTVAHLFITELMLLQRTQPVIQTSSGRVCGLRYSLRYAQLLAR